MNKNEPKCSFDLAGFLSPALFKALCDPTRLAILARIAGLPTPQTIGEIAASCPIDLSVVSRHLRILKEAGILSCEKRGREVFCRIDGPGLAARLRALADAVELCCGGATPPGPHDETRRAATPNRKTKGERS